MTEHVRHEIAEGVLTLVLDRADKKNALTDAMYGALADGLERADADPAVRVVLIRGEGDLFTAGNDIGEFAAVAMGQRAPRDVNRFLVAISTAKKPVVAAVQGRAVGVGTTMLLHCDHVILAEGARLSTPFVNLALVPEAASSLLLPSRVGHLRAFSLFALGEAVEARDALVWGLCNAVVPAAELETAARDVCQRIARQPAGAVLATKRLMKQAEATAAAMQAETGEFRDRLKSPEAREAFTAFAERRAPDFTRFG